MKKLVFLLFASASLFSSELKIITPKSLFKLSAESFVQSMSVRKLCETLLTISEEHRKVLVEAYLEYCEYESVEDLNYVASSLFMKKKLLEEKTTLFSELEKEAHYRPTRFSKNPFVESKDYPFAYTYQDKRMRKGQLIDHRNNKCYSANRMVGQKNIVLVGPTEQGYYGTFGSEDSLAICLLDDVELYSRKRYGHPRKERFIDEKTKMEICVRGRSYKFETITALTMNEELGFFYGATDQGKVYCYHWYTNRAVRRIDWGKSALPIELEKPITDLELSEDGLMLRFLSGSGI